jgi:hypothetical protein
MPQQQVPRIGDVWPAWYRSTDPAAFDVEILDPDDHHQVAVFGEFGLRHPARTNDSGAATAPGTATRDRGTPAPPDMTAAAQPDARPVRANEPPPASAGPGRTGSTASPPPVSAGMSPPVVSRADRPTVGPNPPQDDPVIELERLIRLHDNGSITDEEFSAAKAKYLRS